MTGLGARDASYLYVSSTAQNAAYRYVAPGIYSRYHYMSFTASSDTRDLAILPDGSIWVALDWSSVKLRHYDSGGSLLESIGTDLVPDAWGVTVDDTGRLWVSDTENNLIYAINLSTGVEDGPSPSGGLQVSRNPFSESVTITCEGVENGTLSIYDGSGRLVAERPFGGSTLIEAEGMDKGAYYVMLSSGGSVRSARLLKL